MHGSDRGRNAQAVDWFFPAIGFLIAAGIVWGIGFSQGGESVRRYSAPHQHGQGAQQAALSQCAGRKGADLIDCVQKQIETAEETARAEQDLTAQQQAAWGSMFSALWGGLAVFVTAIGTILLYQQIILTRKAVEDTGKANEAIREANAIARDSARRQMRAYLRLECEKCVFVVGDPITMNIKIINTGQTPAFDAAVKSRAIGRGVNWTWQEGEEPILDERPSHLINPGGNIVTSIQSDEPLTQFVWDGIKSGKAVAYFSGRIDYVDTFGSPHWITFRFKYGAEEHKNGKVAYCSQGNGANRA